MAHHNQEHERESVLADTLKGAVAGGIAVSAPSRRVEAHQQNQNIPKGLTLLSHLLACRWQVP